MVLEFILIGAMPTPATLYSCNTSSFIVGVSANSFLYEGAVGGLRIACFHDNGELANHAASSAYVYV